MKAEIRNGKKIYPIFQSNFAIRLIVSRLGLLCEYDYWLVEYSPIIPQKSISTNIYLCPCMDILTDSYWFQSNTLKLQRALLPHELCAQWSGWADGHYQENGEQWEFGEAGASWIGSQTNVFNNNKKPHWAERRLFAFLLPLVFLHHKNHPGHQPSPTQSHLDGTPQL